MASSEQDFWNEVDKAIDYCEGLGLRPMYDRVLGYFAESKSIVEGFMAEFK
jgi:hypothetical protein